MPPGNPSAASALCLDGNEWQTKSCVSSDPAFGLHNMIGCVYYVEQFTPFAVALWSADQPQE